MLCVRVCRGVFMSCSFKMSPFHPSISNHSKLMPNPMPNPSPNNPNPRLNVLQIPSPSCMWSTAKDYPTPPPCLTSMHTKETLPMACRPMQRKENNTVFTKQSIAGQSAPPPLNDPVLHPRKTPGGYQTVSASHPTTFIHLLNESKLSSPTCSQQLNVVRKMAC